MRRTIILSRMFSIVFLCGGVAMATAQEQQQTSVPINAPFAGATISDWKGKVHLTLPGQSPSSPVRAEILAPGSILDTGGGRLLLQLADGSQILVRPHTRLMVQQPAPTDRGYFQLLLGRIRALINKQTGGAPPFELGTPSAVIAVRGTQFEVEVNQHRETEVDVIEGLVEVISNHTGTSVLVGAGSSTRVGMNIAPETPRPTAELHPNMANVGEDQAPNRANQGAAAASGPNQSARPRGRP
jgi:FecR-like protein